MGGSNSNQATPFHTLSVDMGNGISYAPVTVGEEFTESSSYNPSLRFLMGLCGIPLTLFSIVLLLFSPMMFVFMHDDPKTTKFPGNLYALFVFLVYLVIVGLFAFYSWTLASSAYRGVTVISIPRYCPCGHHNEIRWTSDTRGFLLLLPTVFMLIAYIFSNL